ncbi:MAG: hypothetical protein JW884_07780, partial [Deltaproteobacteria bacterium]|nr:hypothetical protein [Deltaproteobacteria bacterium]
IAGAWIIITVPLSFVGIGYVSAAFFIIGVSSGAVATTTWSLVNDTTPRRIMGLMSGFLNPFPLLGMAILQSLTGTILDYIGPVGDMYPPEAFRAAFSLCFAVSVLCLAIAISLRTTVKHSSN